MNRDVAPSCRDFRDLLERKLAGRPSPSSFVELSWHEHLLACGACRRLLESEEALELLLASLPEPHLPPQLAARVIARLRASGTERSVGAGADAGLDRLLELDRIDAAPPTLARDVLARLRLDRELDRLLDHDVVDVPADLNSVVLAGLRVDREMFGAVRTRVLVFRRSWAVAAAAMILVASVAWMLVRGGGEAKLPTDANGDQIASGPHTSTASDEPDSELLSRLDLLEQWDLLTSKDVDVQLSILTPADEALLEDVDPSAIPMPERDAEPEKPRTKG
jgi:hypothetical protein